MMNYKNTILFIGKCLTISKNLKNKKSIETVLQNENVDWDNVVRISTAHFVFPALYCNLKHENLLQYLPEDLVDYMEHITNLNRERNQQIIEQAKTINSLLKDNGITPIFTKGTAFLLENLYDDIAERMVGDIDFIVHINDYQKAYDLLLKDGYNKVHQMDYDFPSFHHLPRIFKEDEIAAVEVHKEMLVKNSIYQSEFNYKTVINKTKTIKNFNFLGDEDHLALTIIANQINDNNKDKYRIDIRNAYDAFLLTRKTNAKQILKNYKILFDPLNNFLNTLNIVMDTEIINNSETKESKYYTKKYLELISDSEKTEKLDKKIERKIKTQDRIKILSKIFTNKTMRTWIFKRITDKNWYLEKFK